MADATKATTLVAFEVGSAMYALDIRHVREILRPLTIEVLPHAPAMVVGVFDHRGDVVPVIDLRVRFDVASRERSRATRWIIVQRGGRFVALVVDRVHEVFGASAAQPRQVPVLGTGADKRGITGALSYRDRLIFEVDVERITDVAAEVAPLALRSGRSEAP